MKATVPAARTSDGPYKANNRYLYVANGWVRSQFVMGLLWPFLSPVKRDQFHAVMRHYLAEHRTDRSRAMPGETHWNARLTEGQVRDIHDRMRGHAASRVQLALEYDISPATVKEIAQERSWRHLWKESIHEHA